MYFEEHETEFEEQLGKVEDARNPPAEPYILEGSPGQWDIDTFAHDLPPRPVADLLVANYFGASSLIRRTYGLAPRCISMANARSYPSPQEIPPSV